MKKIILMAVAGVATALFAETTLVWVFDGYAENEPKATETSVTATEVDAAVFVEAEDSADISTMPGGMILCIR